MNILLISNLYPEPVEFGIPPDTKAVHYFAKDWVQKGYSVLVLHPYWNPLGQIKRVFRFRNSSIKEYSIEGVSVVFGESQILLPHKNTVSKFRQRKVANRFRKYLEKYHKDFLPDRVVVHFPMIAPRFNEVFLKKGKSYGTLHGVDIRTLANCSIKNRITLVSNTNEAYKSIFYRSKVLSEQGLNFGLKANENNLVLSGIDENLIAPENIIQAKFAHTKDCLRMVYAGKINQQKRIDSVLYALYRIKDDIKYKFTLVGDGPELETLIALSEKLGISNCVSFVGKKSRLEVSEYMSKSNVFIMLSKGETLGLVYLEAMGQGCLTIGSKGEGIDGIIKNGENGFLCVPDNIDEISKTLKKVFLLEKKRFDEISLAGYYTVRHMTSKQMGDNYLSMIEI